MRPGERPTGLTRLLRATGHSWQGFRSAFRSEAAFRQELALALVLVPAAFWVGDGAVEWALLVGSVMLVLITELLNSGIEAVVDRVGPEHHKLSEMAKDMGSAAVFVSLVNLAVVWGLVWFF